MGYNQHQSFFLRERWLGKGLRALVKNERFFFEDDAFEKLGLGKNMVQSLQHWLIAVGAVISEGTGKDRVLTFTKFGQWLLENDAALKYFDTVAMLHYNLTAEDEPSSTWYWYFNNYNEDISDKDEIFNNLNEWVQEREIRVVSENSISRDVDCLLRMYSLDDEPDDPEEVISSPFSKLHLIKQRGGIWHKNEIKIPNDNVLFVKYALCSYAEKNEQYEINLEDILNKAGLLGKIYNMNSSTIVQSLTRLEHDPFYKIEFTRTNNLDVIKLPKISVNELLDQHKF